MNVEGWIRDHYSDNWGDTIASNIIIEAIEEILGLV